MGSGADHADAGGCEKTVSVAFGGSEVASVVSFGVGEEAVVALVKVGAAGSSCGVLEGASVDDVVVELLSVAEGVLTGPDEEPEEPSAPVAT